MSDEPLVTPEEEPVPQATVENTSPPAAPPESEEALPYEESLKAPTTPKPHRSKNFSKKLDAILEKNGTPQLEDVIHTLRYVEDVPLQVQVEIARKQLSLKEVISWKTEGVVTFDRVVGEAVDVLIGDRLIARGEIVVINNHYGVRISDITRPDEKVSS